MLFCIYSLNIEQSLYKLRRELRGNSLIQTKDKKEIRFGFKELDTRKALMANDQNQIVEKPSKVLWDYVAPTFDGNLLSIQRPMVTINNFEIKPTFIKIV